MFIALKRSSQSVPKVKVTHDDIEKLENMDMNLFPMYGDIKVASPQGKKPLKTVPVLLKSNITEKMPMEEINKKIDSSFRKLQDEFPQFIEKIRELEEYKSTQNKEPVNVDPDSLEVLKECDKNLKIISQVRIQVVFY